MKHETRRGLGESLEEYARRTGLRADQARMLWRIAALGLLGVTPTGDAFELIALTTAGLCAVTPGVAVPTSNGPTVLE